MSSTISLSMIVKNEERHLKECLESVKNFVDEIVIVDTGSTDGTIDIAKSFNAKIFYFDWTNDFSAARNFALNHSTSDWILYLDADERLDRESAKKLKSLTATKENIGYYCTIISYDSEIQRNNSIRYVRLFKNNPEAQFTGKVHEQIMPSLEKQNYKFIHSDLVIHHIGYDISKDGKKQKALRNLQLLQKDYDNSANDYVLFQIGQSNFVLENFSEARNNFLRLIKSEKLNPQLKAESYCYLAQISFNNFNSAEAEKFISSAIRLNNTQPFYHLLFSKIHLRSNKINEAKDELYKSIKCAKTSSEYSLNNLQQVNVSMQEIIFYGLQLSYQINDSILKQKMIEELSELGEKKFVELIKLIESNSFNKSEDIRSYLNSITKLNLSLLTFILSRQSNKSFVLGVLKELYKNHDHNVDVIKHYALTNDYLTRTNEAINLLEDNFEIIKVDPSALLYLAMFYIKSAQYEKALNIFNLIETEFDRFDEIIGKVRSIKEKLLNSVEG